MIQETFDYNVGKHLAPYATSPIYARVTFSHVSEFGWKVDKVSFNEVELGHIHSGPDLMKEIFECVQEKMTDYYNPKPEEDLFETMGRILRPKEKIA